MYLNWVGADAKEALKYGADAVMVSNHGGRQLDGVHATVRFFSITNKSYFVLIKKENTQYTYTYQTDCLKYQKVLHLMF